MLGSSRTMCSSMQRSSVMLAAAILLVAAMVTGRLQAQKPDPKALVAKVVEEAGGEDALHRKRDVEYVYVYRRGDTGGLDVSLERYLFDGEKSWARYELAENMDQKPRSTIIQGFDGTTTWQVVESHVTTDAASLRRADFLRKTNFYWFAMTFKLLDPGLRYRYEGRREVNGVRYELVKITFDEDVGDVSDTYLLYINPNTWRVDQFLFTVLDFGKTEPLLMEVEYERIDGVLLPTRRRYAPARWNGELRKDARWTDELSLGIRFDNGFSSGLFERPR